MKFIPFQEFLQSVSQNMPRIADPPLDFALKTPLPPGLFIECGVYAGESIRKIAAATPCTVYGFDSFEGLPERWDRPDMAFDKGTFSLNKALPEVPLNVESR